MKKEIFQFSSINALMSGVFTGFFDVKTIKGYGNFGLGCSDGLKGEVIVDNNVVLEAKDTHPVRLMGDHEKLPFAQVTNFCPEKEFDAVSINKQNLYSVISKHTLLDNIFLAIKITGIFDTIKVRTPNDNGHVYKDAIEVSNNQIVRDLTAIKGSLIGFWTPKFFENISVAGFHLHFLSEDRQIGGHVIDFDLEQGSVSYETKYKLNVELPSNSDYLEKNLDIENMDEIIKKVEN